MAYNKEEEDLEYASPESGEFNKKEEGYSHQTLVMKAYRKILDNASKEPVKGHNEIFEDERGKKVPVYIKDQRKELIASIETLMMVMNADLKGTPQQKEIENCLEELHIKYKNLIKEQKEFFDSQDYSTKEYLKREYPSLTFAIKMNFLQEDLHFHEFYLMEKMIIFKKIWGLLEDCISLEKKNYKSEQVGEGYD